MAWPLFIVAIASIVFCGQKITQRKLFQESKNFGTSRRLIAFLDAFSLPVSDGGLVLDFTSNPAIYQPNYLLTLF